MARITQRRKRASDPLRQNDKTVNRPALAAPAIMFAGMSACLWYLLERRSFDTAFASLTRHPDVIKPADLALLVVAIAIPACAGALALLGLWHATRLIRLATYLNAVHTYCAHRIPSLEAGERASLAPQGIKFNRAGEADAAGKRTLAALTRNVRYALVLGDCGSGKSTSLYQIAHQRSRLRWLIPIGLGLSPLPVLLSVPAYADALLEGAGDLVHYLIAQIAAFGQPVAANKLQDLLRRWNILILCDDVDEVSPAQRARVVSEFHTLSVQPHSRIDLVFSCELLAYLLSPEDFVCLQPLERIVLVAHPAKDVLNTIQNLRRSTAPADSMPESLTDATDPWQLGAQLTHLATCRALMDLARLPQPLPVGRAQLALTHAEHLCAQGGTEGIEAEQIAYLLGRLALSMRMQRRNRVPIPQGCAPGQVMRSQVEAASNFAPFEGRVLAVFSPADEKAHAVMLAAIRTGVLEWEPGKRGVRFTQHRYTATFAARALHVSTHSTDSGSDRHKLSAELLDPTWHEAVVTWGACADPGTSLAGHLLVLANQLRTKPAQTLTRAAGQKRTLRTSERQTALGLSLAIALERLVARGASDGRPQIGQTAVAEQDQEALRSILDKLIELMRTAAEREALGEGLAALAQTAAVDISHHLAVISRNTRISRLLRAQTIRLLGIMPGPTAAAALVALLPETDSVLRQAVDSAFSHAPIELLLHLQGTLGSPIQLLRARAQHVLSLAGEPALAVAKACLQSENNMQRASGAHLLGVLSPADNAHELLACLDDNDPQVRLAAIRSIGQTHNADMVDFLQARLEGTSGLQRAEIAQALGELRYSTALPILARLLEDLDDSVRVCAAEALGKLGDDQAIHPLLNHLTDADPRARAAAASALRRLGYVYGIDREGQRASPPHAHMPNDGKRQHSRSRRSV